MDRPPAAWRFYGITALITLGIVGLVALTFWKIEVIYLMLGVGGICMMAAYLEYARHTWNDPPEPFRLRDWW